jgi:RNA 2',3'-cyclic 3'-phosphodiesterase
VKISNECRPALVSQNDHKSGQWTQVALNRRPLTSRRPFRASEMARAGPDRRLRCRNQQRVCVRARRLNRNRPLESHEPTARHSPYPNHLRLFVALELPQPARAALVAFRDAAADPPVWRPVAAEALHLTLAFLGRRPATDVAVVDPILRAAAGSAPRLAFAGAVLLPPRRARVLCAALEDPDGTLAELQARVSDGLAAAGVYVPEKRPFRAHATVARLRPRARAPRAVEAAPEPLEFDGEALTLFVSRLHPHGARYEPLVRVSFH